MSLSSSLSWSFALVALVAPAASADPHPFSVEDLVDFDRVAEPDVSPDGKLAVFTVSSLDLPQNRRRTDLWVVPTAAPPAGTSAARRLTSHESGDASPAFSPDGKWIYFLSGRSGGWQVWRIAPDGGEAERVTLLPLDVNGFSLAPDGKTLALAIDVFPDCTGPEVLTCTKARLDEREAQKASGRVYDELFFRHWDTWADGRRTHLVVVPVAGGAVRDLMAGMKADCPSKPFGGMEEMAWSPDGATIVFSARNVGREEAWSTDFDLYAARVAGGNDAAPVNLTPKTPGTDTAPKLSPDGKTLLWLSMARGGYESDRFRIMARDVSRGLTGGAEREVAPRWDRSPAELTWSADGKTLYATADDLGQHALFAIDLASGRVKTLAGDGTFGSPRLAGKRLVVARDDLRSPVELFTIGTDGKDLRPLTRMNASRLANVKLGEPSQFSFAGWNGETVYGWVVKPVGYDAAKKWPVAFLIHGGPQGSFGNHFHYRWNPQAYAAAGYAAVMIDFHGSTGYGQAFTDAIRGDWGGKPLEDLQKGLAAVLAKHAALDGDRVCALGASYGGYMINWIAGNWPDRFKCLVNHDGNLDERMAYFDTEELWFPEWEHGGLPWDKDTGYGKHNPIDHVDKWQTPMLVIHGGQDFRVVETQGMGTFTALQRKGIPSRFLYFPDENHWVLKPANSILWHKTVLEWLGRWTAK